MTCQKEIPHDIHIISNKMWSADNHTVSTFSPREASTRDVTHSFLNFTFTRALCKNVAKKMRKLNDDLADIMNMGDSAESYDLYFHKYICEVCLSVEPCDFVFQASAFHTILNCFSSSQQKSKSVDNGPELRLNAKSPEQSLPLLTANYLPLFYINTSNVRFFVPKVTAPDKVQSDGSGSTKHGLTNQDIIVAFFDSLSVVPQADNPLPRHPVDKELYHRAMHANLTQQPGSAIENRQYQIDIKGMSMCTGIIYNLNCVNSVIISFSCFILQDNLLKDYSRNSVHSSPRTKNYGIDGEMISLLVSGAVDHEFYPWLGQTKAYEIGICYFSTKYTT